MRVRSLILVSIAILLACGYASAAESRHMSADGGGSRPENSAATNDRGDLGDADSATPTSVPLRKTEKVKVTPAPHGSGTRASAPRWHSFLPGMFR